MTLAERIYWFQQDYRCVAEGTVGIDYLSKIIAQANQGIKELGIPNDGYEQTLYDDLVELHNRAVDLINDLMKGGK